MRYTVSEFIKEILVVIGIVTLKIRIPVFPHRLVAHHEQGDVSAHVERLQKQPCCLEYVFACFGTDFRDQTFIVLKRYFQTENEFYPFSEAGPCRHELSGKGTVAYGILVDPHDDIVLHRKKFRMDIDESSDP